MFTHRLAVGTALIALTLAVAWLDSAIEARVGAPGVAIAIAAAPVLIVCAMELAAMLRARGARISDALAIFSALSGLAIGAVTALAPNADRAGALSIPLLALWLLLTLITIAAPRRTNGALASAGAAALVLILIGVIPSSFLVLRQHETAWTVIALVLITKSSDIGAYFVGTTIGRNKLIPWLSPDKTWEGLVGAMAAAALVGAGVAGLSTIDGLATVIAFPLGPIAAAGVGAGLAVVGQAGDLTISLFKRDAGLKDSSGLFPGMGGALDVIDSLLFIGPAAHWLLVVIST